ncbi:MAG: helix-turn-helix domain-containing protein [Aminipila sp.]
MDITRLIKKIMIEKDIKQKDLAERLRVAPSNLAKETAKNNDIKIKRLEEIADVSDCYIKVMVLDKKSGKVLAEEDSKENLTEEQADQ